MASDAKVIVKLGPFKTLDARSAGEYVDPSNATALSNVDTHRFGGALGSFYGRKFLCQLPILGSGAQVGSLARYDTSPTQTYFIVQTTGNASSGAALGAPGTCVTAYYDPIANTSGSLSNVTNPFTRAVQSNGVLLLDNGQQIFLAASGRLASAYWQYPTPSASTYSYQVQSISSTTPLPGTSDAPVTYTYAFVQKILITTLNQIIYQVTSPQYDNAAGTPFTVVANGTNAALISGYFSGTTVDGWTFNTIIYRMSSDTNVFQQLEIVSSNNAFIDNYPDSTLAANPQLVINRQQPPTGISDPTGNFTNNPIESLQDRMWVLARVQSNALTNGQPQTQLWYSNPGQPWSFDASLQALLAGDENTTLFGATTPLYPATTFGDQPMALAKLGSTLMIFKSLSSSVVYGSDQTNYQILPFLADIGTVAPLSVTKGDGVVFWLSQQNGVYMFDGNSPQMISELIMNTLTSISPSQQALAVGFYGNYTYFLSFPSQGITLAYYVLEKQWTILPYATNAVAFSPSLPSDFTGTPLQFNQIVAARYASAIPTLDLWCAQDADVSGPVTMSWTSAVTPGENPQQQKVYKYVSVTAPQQQASCVVTLTIDPGFNSAPTVQTFTFDLSSGLTTKVQRVNQETGCKGFAAQVGIVVTSTASNGAGPLQVWKVLVGGNDDVREWSVPS